MQDRELSAAVRRSVWLAQIADALDEALSAIAGTVASDNHVELLQLIAQINALKVEVESLRVRRSRPSSMGFEPNRIDLWPQAAPTAAPRLTL